MMNEESGITKDYEEMWLKAKPALLANDVEFDPVPDATSTRWGISVVLRFRAALADRLAKEVEQLAQWTGRGQVLYDQRSLHTTVRSIEFHRLDVTADKYVMRYAHLLQEVANNYRPIKVVYRGLTATNIGVMAQGWPVDSTLSNLRSIYHGILMREQGLPLGPERKNIRRTAHASLVVFTSPLLNPTALVEYIEQHRSTEYGLAVADKLELVSYQRSEIAVNLLTLAAIPLIGK